MSDPIDLKGRTILITGAASGIGRALALGFVRDGAIVYGADIDTGGLDEVAREGVRPALVDVALQPQVDGLVARILAETGRLDVLFNNAGIGHGDLIENFTPGFYERYIRIHVFGAVYGLHAAIPIMKAQNFGRIINTLSRVAEGDRPGTSAYGSAKAALWQVTRVAAREVAKYDILVNGLIPGFTQSGMTKGIPDLQPPEVVYPHARFMASLPKGGPSGKVFWNSKDYPIFAGLYEGAGKGGAGS